MKFYTGIFDKIISLENLFSAWEEFKKGKLKKKDVLEYEWNLELNIIELHRDLKYHRYGHSVYTSFNICDPKPRKINKAIVRDRILHHAIFRVLNPLFEPTFISNSFSCRIGKGNHKGVAALSSFLNKASKNYRQSCFVLKCDVKKFFDSVDHEVLLSIIRKIIKDDNAIRLLERIIKSFSTKPNRERERERESKKCRCGIPIGNLTSQLFANIYMNECDQFIKHNLRIKHYARYTDDFVIVSDKKEYLESVVLVVKDFLKDMLKLELHPNKISIRKFNWGIDFLGYVNLPHHRQLRTRTRKRIFKKLKERVEEYKLGLISQKTLIQSLNSFTGILCHANCYHLRQELTNKFWFWLKE